MKIVCTKQEERKYNIYGGAVLAGRGRETEELFGEDVRKKIAYLCACINEIDNAKFFIQRYNLVNLSDGSLLFKDFLHEEEFIKKLRENSFVQLDDNEAFLTISSDR